MELTDEQKKYLDAAVAKAQADAKAQYDAEAHQFREWIKANPLPAARVIGTVALIVGILVGYWGKVALIAAAKWFA